MSRRMAITHGQKIRLQGRDYEFLNAVPAQDENADAHDLQFRDVHDHRVRAISQAEFDDLYVAGEVRWWNAFERPYDDGPADQCQNGDACLGCNNCSELARRRSMQGLLKAFDDDPVSKTDVALQQFLDQREQDWPAIAGRYPRAAVFRRMLREWGEPGDRRLSYIGRSRALSGRRKSRLHPAAESMLWEKADAYFSDRRVSSDDVHAALDVALRAKNRERATSGLAPISIPSRVTVWRRLTEHMDYDKTRARHGARVAQRTFVPLKRHVTAQRILDVAVMDHTVIDCFVVDDEHHIPVGRPYLTVVIDVRSRYPLGYHVSFTPPSIESAMACLRKVVRPKADLNNRHPDVRPWQVFGVPRTLLVDNGWEFIGRSFKDACEDAGISVEWAPVKTPEYKGIVERFFGTLNKQLFHKMRGGVPFKPQLLAEYGIDSTADAVLLLSELDELIHQFVVELYGRNYHSGLKAVPEQVWKEREAIDGIEYAKNLRGLDHALSRVAERTLNRKGIEFKCLTYNSDAVFDLLNTMLPKAARRGRAAHSLKVKIKYWPDDLSQVAVWNTVTNEYVSLPCVDQEYASGLSEHHHEVLMRYAQEKGLAFSSDAERAAARAALQEKAKTFVQDRRLLGRKRGQRLAQAPERRDLSDDLQLVSGLEIGTLVNRKRGDEIQKGPHRRKNARKSAARKTVGVPAHSTTVRPSQGQPGEVVDPFAGTDRQALLARFRQGERG